LPLLISATPATTVDAGYVKVFTAQGKSVWVKLSLPSGGASVSLAQGHPVTFRLDYVFDAEEANKPVEGDTLNLSVSGFPNGTFLLPTNNHTSNNFYRGGVITLTFANASNPLIHAVDGWMTVSFLSSGSAGPGTYNPKIMGVGTAENVLNITSLVVLEPGTNPGPSGPPQDLFNMSRKLAEHVLYPDGNGGYISQFSEVFAVGFHYYLTAAPAYISYELLVQEGSGNIWENGRIKEFDYLTITDTLGPGQEFVMSNGEPFPDVNTVPLQLLRFIV
jgi:hypothetical protein